MKIKKILRFIDLLPQVKIYQTQSNESWWARTYFLSFTHAAAPSLPPSSVDSSYSSCVPIFAPQEDILEIH